MLKTILCIEDDTQIANNLKKTLTDAGYAVLTAKSLNQVREHVAARVLDGIILDITFPDGNSLDYLKEIREQSNHIPVLMLADRNRDADVARGLDAGADDWIEKPFTYDLLLSRIKKILFRAVRLPERLTCGSLSLDVTAMAAYMNGRAILLTQKEFSLLLVFTQNENRIISAEYLFEKAWGTLIGFDKRTLKKHISNLRNRLKDVGAENTIRAVYSEGYIFEKV